MNSTDSNNTQAAAALDAPSLGNRDPRDPLGLNTDSTQPAGQSSTTTAAGPEPIHDAASGETLSLMPYAGRYDANAHHFLGYLWNQLREDGSLASYFPERNASGDLCGFHSFVALMSDPAVKIQLIVRGNLHTAVPDDLLYPVGAAIATAVQHGSATVLSVRLILLDAWWERPAIVEACRRIIATWFTEGTQSSPWLEHLICTIPSADLRSSALLSALGWTLSGSIPNASIHAGQLCAADTWYYTRRMFNQYSARRVFGDWQPPADLTTTPSTEGN